MTVLFRPLLSLGLCAALLAPAAAQAAEEIEDAIGYRQAAFSVMAWQLGPMGAMAQGKIDYDAAVFAERAANLAAVAHLPWEGFIEGSLQGDGHGIETGALAAIGEDRQGFQSRRETFEEAATTLAELVESGAEFNALRRQVGAVANSCKGCHDDYRAE